MGSRVSPRLQSLDERPTSISEMVYDAIRQAIIDKTLPPGSSVSEVDLARDLNVSKTPVREALLRLRELHVVESDGNRGLRVVHPSRAAITEAYEARWGLESATASLAAARASDAQRALVREAADESVVCAEAYRREEFGRRDRVFHHRIAEAAASPRLAELANNALLVTGVLRARDAPMSGDSVTCAREHVDIAEAIQQGEEKSAADLAAAHVQHVLGNVLAALTVDATEQPDRAGD